jgi:OmpA-OmpF porin, OOP family
MKNIKPLLFLLFVFNYSFSQQKTDSISQQKIDSPISQKKIDSTIATSNNYRWRFELGIGDSRGIRPYSDGYYSSNSQKVLGTLYLNSVNIGATYTYSKLLGFKLDVAFDRFTNKDKRSLPFEVAQYRASLQGIINLNSLFKYQKDTSRFNLLFHAGFTVSTLQKIESSTSPIVGSKELNGGIVAGITPMYRITKKSYIFFDFSSFYNYRQHYTWDGSYSKSSNNLAGQMINGSIGITYSLGKLLKWEAPDSAEIKKLEDKNEELEKRVGDLETMMNDTDKDGVADYLDSENNSVAGVAVDSRGVMVDSNRNGVPDELERYFEKTYGNPTNTNSKPNDTTINSSTNSSSGFSSKETSKEDFLKRSINEGYITVFFEINSAKPNTYSLDGISFILTYLKANPNATIDIIGYSDEVGNNDKNQKLALARAKNVKKTLVKSGIDEARLNAISGGEDTSVDPTSKEARSVVRKVIFKLK